MSLITPETSRALPLDWTRVQRKRRPIEDGGQCCDDPVSCGSRHKPQPRLNPSITLSPNSNILNGIVVFCLHEINPDWFQGYFIPTGSRQPWGLLAVQEEVEECLVCADGGFRRISLTIYRPSCKPIKLKTIDWTGGDMIQLRHERVDLEANKIWTGKSSLPYAERYFKGLIDKLRIQYDAPENSPVLDWLPDVAVVVGTITLALPKGDKMSKDSRRAARAVP